MNKPLLLLLLAPRLLAQYPGEGPTVVSPYAPHAPLGAAALAVPGVTNVYQVNLRPHASLPAGTYYACLTVNRTTASTYALLTGTYDANTGLFTKNTDIDGINPSFTLTFGLSVSNDLLTAVFDNGSSAVRWATRPNTTSPFTLQPAAATGLPAAPNGYYDPNFGLVNGVPVLFFTTQSAIQFGDWVAGAVSNIKTVTTIPGTAVHSPMPMFDKTGTTRAVTYVQTTSGTAPYKLMYASSLLQDAGAPPYAYFTDPASSSWLENGDASGGTVTIISGQNGYTTPYRIGILAASSSSYPAAVATTVNLTTFAPQQGPTAVPYLGAVILGNLGAAGIPIGGVTGLLSLSPIGLVALPSGTYTNSSGTLELNIPVGPLPAGAKVWYQSVLLDALSSQVYLGGTGKVEWR
jgi:hypothetical protein